MLFFVFRFSFSNASFRAFFCDLSADLMFSIENHIQGLRIQHNARKGNTEIQLIAACVAASRHGEHCRWEGRALKEKTLEKTRISPSRRRCPKSTSSPATGACTAGAEVGTLQSVLERSRNDLSVLEVGSWRAAKKFKFGFNIPLVSDG